MTQPLPSAGWYPHGACLRWWDGYRWTHLTQPLPVRTSPTQEVSVNPKLLTERALVFRHKAELLEHHRWTVTDHHDVALGSVVPIDYRWLERKTDLTVEFRDEHDALIHTVTERVVRFRGVSHIVGVGRITQGTRTRPTFALHDENDQLLATIECTGTWSHRYVIRDAENWQIGRIDYEVVPAKRFGMIDRYEMWTHLDHPIRTPLPAPLTSLILATVPRAYTAIFRRDRPS
ncbi:DUF2510 domain-containing protein [Nocardia sp. 2]|uniref:DUF2510 domain-containing protein n=1 Tax=Nocardia acididurans TaxID=2802282 RepID=A0ABS1M6I5_9NOCA|nr:DUF2510 domain-containing protein [Nocardia acididurans]MBL1076262.1 DUF2510 domain-containing protein [Nocardia acididurans]